MGLCCEKTPPPTGNKDGLLLRRGNIHDVYDIKDVVGEGAFGSVVRAVRKSDAASPQSRARAIKILRNDAQEIQVVMLEVEILAEISHPSIAKLYEAFQDKTHTYLVLELCEGGDLFGAILAAKVFTEKQAAHVIRQIFQSIRYLHEKMIAHRDVKGENFLVQSGGPIETSIIKLVDFGTARHFEPGATMETALGTPTYMAPEVILTRYGPACDLWSCGVLLYILLCGHAPFQGKSDSETIKLARQCELRFRKDYWVSVSKEAVNLVKCLIKRQVQLRSTAAQALEHAWLTDMQPGEKSSSSAVDGTRLQQRLGAFCTHTRFKKMALDVVARNICEADIGELRDVFISIDTDKTGFVSKEELRSAMSRCGSDNMDSLLRQLDADGDGCIDYREFLVATMDKKYYRQEDVLRDAFNVFDTRQAGTIDKNDILRVLASGGVKHSIPQEEVAEMFAEIGKDSAHSITFEEFKVVVGGGESVPPVPQQYKTKMSRATSVEWMPILQDRTLKRTMSRTGSASTLSSQKSFGLQDRNAGGVNVKNGAWVEEPDGSFVRRRCSRTSLGRLPSIRVVDLVDIEEVGDGVEVIQH